MNEDEELYDDERDEPEQTVWTCSCGCMASKRPMGAMCPKCGAYMEEEPMY